MQEQPKPPAAGMLLVLLLSALGQLAKCAIVEVPLPYGSLRHKPAPKGYVAHQCSGGITIDGNLQEPCWTSAPTTDQFIDIVGPAVTPWFATTAKMLWDADNLYIAADLVDTRLFAYETQHDSVIFHDNDFEVFIDPDGDNWMYYELEVNARGQVWDLQLIKPYRNGGPPIMNWETVPPGVPTQSTGPTGWRPAQVAVQVQGDLNAASGSTSWFVEMALPWSLLQQAANRQVPPAHGDRWRINFSRVHWNVTWSEQQQRYVKEPPDQPGYNFVWSPQWQVQMHQPETWGYVQFSTTPVPLPPYVVRSAVEEAVQSGKATAFVSDETWSARALLMDVYYSQTLCWQEHRRFCSSLAEASQQVDFSDVTQQVDIQTTKVSFIASTEVQLADGSRVVVMVDQLSRLVQTPAGPAGTLPLFNPFEGTSTHPAVLLQEVDCKAAACLQQEL